MATTNVNARLQKHREALRMAGLQPVQIWVPDTIRSDAFSEHASLTVLPVTSTLIEAPLLHVTLQPNAGNGLQKPSQVMADKAMTVEKDKAGPAFGRIDVDAMVQVERCLGVFLGIAK